MAIARVIYTGLLTLEWLALGAMPTEVVLSGESLMHVIGKLCSTI